MILRICFGCAAALVLLTGCEREVPRGSLVLTQTPMKATAGAPTPTVLDVRYPAGSRVVLLTPPFRADSARELSRGLVAAGDPCTSWDGRWVYFAGKRSAGAEWQIYRVAPGGGQPEPVTQMPGGAMDPAVAAHGELVFSSPVPPAGRLWTGEAPVAIYGQLPGQKPTRFTYGPDSAVNATVLRDGRILFVTAQPRDDRRGPRHLGLFAMNNDGTEVTAYACVDDGAEVVRRPRELDDGRVAFLAGRTEEPGGGDWAEGVRSAAPFATRAGLFAFPGEGCRSIEATPEKAVLVSVDRRTPAAEAVRHAAIYRVAPGDAALGAPIVDDPQWNSLEAIGLAARAEPAGHTTAVMPAAASGTMLCLNVNESSVPAANRGSAPAASLRVYALTSSGAQRELGTVPVASDGSVLVRLPVRLPLGFDTLDAEGRVLRHQPPFVWLHPGENRGCVGCHERRNHAPRNVRPLATGITPVQLDVTAPNAAPRASAP